MASPDLVPETATPRVCHVINTARPGGGARHVAALLRRAPTTSTLVVGEGGPLEAEAEALGVRVHLVPFMGRPRWDLRWVAHLARELRAIGPDLVHCHGTRSAFLYALARPVFRDLPPCLYTEHGLSHRQELSPMRRQAHLVAERVAVTGCDHLVCVAGVDAEDIHARGWIAPGAVSVIANGIDPAPFIAAGRRRAGTRRALGVATGSVLVAVVSRLVAQKAVTDAVAAIGRAAATLSPGTLRAIVAGDGEQRAAVEQAVRSIPGGATSGAVGSGDPSAAALVSLLGARDDIPALLAAADVYLLTSRWEGLPIGLLEAMAAGRAIVATATEGATEVLEHERTGLLVPVGDVPAIAAALERLAGDPGLRKRLGAAARAVVRERYSEAAMVQATRALHQRLAKRQGSMAL